MNCEIASITFELWNVRCIISDANGIVNITLVTDSCDGCAPGFEEGGVRLHLMVKMFLNSAVTNISQEVK